MVISKFWSGIFEGDTIKMERVWFPFNDFHLLKIPFDI